MSNILVSLNECAIEYDGITYLSDVSFLVQDSELRAIVGPNGTGKTSLLRIISGLELPKRGRVERRDSLEVAMMFQNYRESLLPWATVEQNIKLVLTLKDNPIGKERVKDLMKAFGIYNFSNRLVYTLSGGQQQRTALVQILCYDPELILLDEPLSAIDYSQREKILYWLKDYLSSQKITSLMVTHDMREAKNFSTFPPYVVNGGKIHELNE